MIASLNPDQIGSDDGVLSVTQVNTVGFYQLSKICITPAVLIFDAVISKAYPTKKEIGAVCLLCIGVTLATITDAEVSTNLVGFAVALAAIGFTAVYQVRPLLTDSPLARKLFGEDQDKMTHNYEERQWLMCQISRCPIARQKFSLSTYTTTLAMSADRLKKHILSHTTESSTGLMYNLL